MSIDACIAHAIHSDLDIITVCPEYKNDIPVGDIGKSVEAYILHMQQEIVDVVKGRKGRKFLKRKDAAALCATMLKAGIDVPVDMLLKMCKTIIQLYDIESTFILDTEDGISLYYLKVKIDVSDLFPLPLASLQLQI